MGLDFGSHPDVVFDRPPLRTVLTQVRFPPILSLFTAVGVAGFQAALQEEYPTFLSPEQGNAVAVPGEEGKQLAPVWRMVEGPWTVGLAVDFVTLETTAYTSTEDFLTRFGRVVKVLHEVLRPAPSLRIGLRKVNAIALPDPGQTASLVGLVRPEILGVLALEHLPAPLTQGGGAFELTDDFNTLTARYGLSGSSEQTANFMLDIDCATTQPYSIEPGPDLLGVLRHFSESATSFFHWATTDDFREALGPRPRSSSASEADDL